MFKIFIFMIIDVKTYYLYMNFYGVMSCEISFNVCNHESEDIESVVLDHDIAIVIFFPCVIYH